MGDFSDVLNAFQAAQREAATTEKECVARVRAASTAMHDQGSDVLVNVQGYVSIVVYQKGLLLFHIYIVFYVVLVVIQIVLLMNAH